MKFDITPAGAGLMLLSAALLSASCTGIADADGRIDSMPAIYPDYTGVTVAPNLVAPRFWVPDSLGFSAVAARFEGNGEVCPVKGKGNMIDIGAKRWRRLVGADSVKVTVMGRRDGKWLEYEPFCIYISPDSIDSHIAYRLIEPGYETWNEMGIYQRDLESYDQSAIITNRSTGYGCMNCHSFCQQNPDRWLMHLRVDYGGTYVVDGQLIKKLNTKMPETISALVYPSWHPSGDFVAFSVNNTKQMFHTTDPNCIEVMDYASDVVVYDARSDEALTSPLLFSPGSFETFPTFSPDGRSLYFCSADSVAMPAGYDRLKYHLCRIDFDPETRTFGNSVDTIFRADSLSWGSASFPRVSPDGRRLLVTLSGYGNFSIWHHDADLYMVDLATGEMSPVKELNSDDTESYHSWSHNGRWVVFSSRRIDGLYTRLYLAHIDADGRASKPLLLPQPTEDYYMLLMKSYNVPEFITGAVTTTGARIRHEAETAGIDVTMHK